MLPILPAEIRNFLKNCDISLLTENIKRNPTIIKAYMAWENAYQNLVDSNVEIKALSSTVQELHLKYARSLDLGVFTTKFLRSSNLRILAVEEVLELINIGLESVESIFQDKTIPLTIASNPETLIPIFKRLDSSIIEEFVEKDCEKTPFLFLLKDILPPVIRDKVSNQVSLSVKTISCAFRSPTSYKINFDYFMEDFSLFKALLEINSDLGQNKIIETISDTNYNGHSLLSTYALPEFLNLIFSLIEKLDANNIKKIILIKERHTSLLLHSYLIEHSLPLILNKLEAEDIVELLTHIDKDGDTPLSTRESVKAFISQIEKHPGKFTVPQIKKILMETKKTPMKIAIYHGIIDKNLLYMINGLDFDAKTSYLRLPKLGLLDDESENDGLIQKNLFQWAIIQPQEKQTKAIEFSIHMGCKKQFLSYLSGLSEQNQMKILSGLNIEDLIKILHEPERSGRTILHYIECEFLSCLPLLNFLLENGHLESVFKPIFKTRVKEEVMNKIITFFDVPNNKKYVKDLFSMKINDEFFITFDNYYYLLCNLSLNEEQIAEILSLQDNTKKTLFYYLIKSNSIENQLLFSKINTKTIIHLLSTLDDQNNSPLFQGFNNCYIYLKKVLSDNENGGLTAIDDILSTTKTYYEDVIKLEKPLIHFTHWIPFLKDIANVKNGAVYLKSLLLNKSDHEKKLTHSNIGATRNRELFDFLCTIDFSPYEVVQFLTDGEPIAEWTNDPNFIGAAIPFFEILLKEQKTKEWLIKMLVFVDINYAINNFYEWDTFYFFTKLYPVNNFLSSGHFMNRISTPDYLFKYLLSLRSTGRLNEIIPLLHHFSSEQILKAISTKTSLALNFSDPKVFSEIVFAISGVLSPSDLSLLLMEIYPSEFRLSLTKNLIKKEILFKAFSFDFDSKLYSEEGGSFESSVSKWFATKKEGPERARSFLLILFLEYKNLIREIHKKLTTEEKKILFSLVTEKEYITFISSIYAILPEHMQEQVQIDTKPPKPLSFSHVEFVGVEKKENQSDDQPFYSFISDMISGAINDGVNSGYPLSGTTVAGLRSMEEKIRNNEHVYGIHSPYEEDYRIFCSYLSHVIMGYKIGQVGGDGQDKLLILDRLAEQTSYCFPGWKQMIQQCYSFISNDEKVQAVTLKDRVLARLQAERIFVLSVRMLMFGETDNIHEPNYLLDMFREDLGTQLDPINDPHTQRDFYPLEYGKDKTRLRAEFDEIYTVEFLLGSITCHINEQHERTRESKSMLDLPPQWVSDWLRDRCAGKWKEQEYADIPNVVSKMQLEGKGLDEIDAFLLSYGIERRQEEKLDDAIYELKRELSIARKRDFIKISTSLKDTIDEIFLCDDLNKLSLKKKEFLDLNQHIKCSVNADKQQLRKGVDEYILSQKRRIKNLEDLLGDVEKNQSESDKKVLLKRAGKIMEAQLLEEVLKPSAIKEAQIAKFFNDVVYQDVEIMGKKKRMFTLEAAAFLLESMDIITSK